MSALKLRLGQTLRLSPKRRGALQPAGFSPASLADIAFWFDAAQSPVVASAGAVERWDDLTASGRDAAQVDPDRRPVLGADTEGRAVLSFDGADDWLRLDDAPAVDLGLTAFVVFRLRTQSDASGILTAGSAVGTDEGAAFAFRTGLAQDQVVVLSARSGEADPLEIERPDSTGLQYAIVTLGSADGSVRDLGGAGIDTSTSAALQPPTLMALGARLSEGEATGFAALDLYEVGLYTRVLTPAEIDQLEGYLVGRRALGWTPLHYGRDLAWLHDAGRGPFDLVDGAVSAWRDLSLAARDLTPVTTGAPEQVVDTQDRQVVRFDGVDDLLHMAGPLPALDPFSVALVYRVRERNDFAGLLSASAPSGADHEAFWSLHLTSDEAEDVQLSGRSLEPDPLLLLRDGSDEVQIAIWTTDAGSAEIQDRLGTSVDTYDGAFGVPAEIVVGGRYDGAPFGFAAIDVYATVGVARALTAADQQHLLAWAAANWGV